MRKSTFFAAVLALAVLGIDAWLSARTMTQGALAGSTTFNRLIISTSAKTSTVSHYDDFLFVSD